MSIPAPHPQTFGWIKGALDGSMSAVMSQVVLAERDSNFQQLATVPDNLHQIHGSLKMVELEAAGMLAESLEVLCQQVCNTNSLAQQSRGLRGLRRGLEALQGYIDSIARQSPVSPLTLVDQINLIKELTGDQKISRFDLFTPPIGMLSFDQSGSKLTAQRSSSGISTKLVSQLRRKYRRALLALLGGRPTSSSKKQPLAEISDLLNHLFRISSLDISQQLWRVASSFVDAIAAGEIISDARIKSMFAHLDLEISRLEEDTAAGITADPPDELLRELLFYIGAIENAESESIKQIQQKLKLSEWFGNDVGQIDQQVATSTKLLQLSGKFKDRDFINLETQLSRLFSNSNDELVKSSAEVLQGLFGNLAEFASDANLDDIQSLVNGISKAVVVIDKSQDSLAITSGDIKIASALLFIRDGLNNPSAIDATWSLSIASHQQEIDALIDKTEAGNEHAHRVQKIASAEYHHAKSAAAKQVQTALVDVEYVFARYEKGEATADELDGVATQLYQVGNVFTMGHYEPGANLSRQIAVLLSELGDGKQYLSSEGFEPVAFAITALGLGADHLVHPGSDTDSILESASSRIANIEREADLSSVPMESADAFEIASLKVSEVAEVAISENSETSEKPQEVLTHTNLLSRLDADRQQLNVNDKQSFQALGLTLGELESEALVLQQEKISVLAGLGRSLCELLESGTHGLDSESEDFLGLLIRQIKELSVGESDQIDPGDPVGLAPDQLQSSTDLDAWRIRLDTLVDSQEVAEKESRPEVDVELVADSSSDTPPNLIQLDKDLKAIFIAEYCNHLATLETELGDLNSISDETGNSVEKELIFSRVDDCIHTLSGNCRNLGFDTLADCVESCLELLRHQQSENTAEGLTHFENGLTLFKICGDQIERDGEIDSATESGLNEHRLKGESYFSVPKLEFAISDIDDAPAILPPRPVNEIVDLQVVDAQGDEMDEEIRQIFLDESENILGRINSHLISWRESGPDEVVLSGIRREFHTLKGSAAATGYDDISALSHSIETLMDQHKPDADAKNGGILNLLEEMHDGLAADLGFMTTGSGGHIKVLNRMVAGVVSGDSTPEQATKAATEQIPGSSAEQLPPLNGSIEQSEESGQEPEMERVGVDDDLDANKESLVQGVGLRSWMPSQDHAAAGLTSVDEATMGGSLRIDNNKLAELINTSGELGLLRTQLQSTLDATSMDLDVLRASMSSMREGLRDLELEADAQIRARPEQPAMDIEEDFDPLQLDRYSAIQGKSREVTELLDQLTKVERGLGNRASDLGGVLQHQLHLGDQLQSGLLSARMVSVGEYLPRLRYLVRETSKQAKKDIQLRFTGGDILADRQVIESMMAPFEHMIRNSVAHGFESAALRKAGDKSETGTISIILAQQGSELVVTFSDDGAGLAIDKLSHRAVDLGLAENIESVSEVDLLQVIAQPGYSTSDQVSLGSGRGVGMDVVYQAVRDLGGSMTMTNVPGQGVSFQFRLPVTLALTQALLVKVGNWRFAIRSRTIERLIRVPVDELIDLFGEPAIEVDGQNIPVISIRQRMGESTVESDRRFVPIVLVRLADRLAAFEVDAYEDSVNIVSKAPGDQLSTIPEISGVTVLADSSIVLVLDTEAFIDRIAPLKTEETDESTELPGQGGLRKVLVVDDSLVVRKVMQKDLELDGLEVETAVDGIHALEVLERSQFDVALVDIEMPRMNGYELLESIRKDQRYQDLPVIIITSRSGDQHRQRAMDLGADGYITKPYNVGELDTLMRDVISSRIKIH